MPELPEVETIRRQLDTHLVGRSVSSAETRWHKSLTGRGIEPTAMLQRPVVRVWRRGKVLGIDADGGVSVLVHLRMTGQLLIEPVTADGPSPRDTPATRVVLDLDDGSRLFFNDQRKFGRMVVLPTTDVPADPLLARMGPEPLEVGFDADVLSASLRRHPGLQLKAALLDQGVVAGIGNIYADEALWQAGLHPERRCRAVRRPGFEALHVGIVTVLSEGVARGGSTLRDYVDAKGDRGGYLEVANVYGRTGQPCPRCGTSVIKTRVVGRGTHLCPACQVAPRRRRSAQY
ncbi:MAG TPA: bifunctional DNA-formamidopyrimidine glycosylase/DNA-(apurinic or apyrimidinic site) lyase [Acidimicrobiales bacterium]